MKVESIGQVPSENNAQPSARDRAVALLNKVAAVNPSQAQEHPVSNPSQVSPEDMTALGVQGRSNEGESSSSEPSDATAPATKDKELLSTQYAQLARREKALYAKAQARERAIAERESAIQAREKAIADKDAEYQSKYVPKDRLAQDTVNVLLEAGLSYEQITERFLSQQAQDPATKLAIQRLEERIRAQDEAREADRKASQEAQTLQYKQALKQIEHDAKSLVMQDTTYETIRATNSIKDVVELIEETFKDEGRIMSVDEACQLVEDHLVEKLSKYSQIGKIQQRMKANASQTQTGNNTQQRQPTPTLTNAVGTSKKLSARERALLAFNNQLKK
jgi:hypothetical protein